MDIGSISRVVLRYRYVVIAFWLVMAIVGGMNVGRAVNALDDGFELPGTKSEDTNVAILQTFQSGAIGFPMLAVAQLPDGQTLDDPVIQRDLQAVSETLVAQVPGLRVASWLTSQSPAMLSEDGRTTYLLIYTPPTGMDAENPFVAPIEGVLANVTIGGQPIHLTGYGLLEAGSEEGGSSALIETLVGGIGALIVLLWAFGSLIALLPVAMAAVAIVCTFLVILGITHFTDVTSVVQFLIALIGLGIAIDYALLVVTRWREERYAGRSNDAAVQTAMETAGHAVIFSGTAVGIGLIALVAIPVPLIRSVGFGGMTIPLVSVIVSITLLPALLATIGPRLDWPKLRSGDQTSPFWTRVATITTRHHWAATIIALVILAALTYPALRIQVGQPGIESLASSGEEIEAYRTLVDAGLPAGALTPFEVVVRDIGSVSGVVTAASGVEGVAGVIAPDDGTWRRDGSAVLTVIPEDDGHSRAGIATMERVRDTIDDRQGVTGVGGITATNNDFVDITYSNVPWALAIIVIITFFLLVRAFRSLVLPIKAIVLNVFSVGAAFGIVVMIWQWGWGSEFLFGTEATGAITNWLPVAVFSFLYGISMDYEVFILARMREEYEKTGDTNAAVIRGMGHTGRLVTTAAVILGLAFVALGAVPQTTLRIMATGLCAGILIDATIVRGLLVPAMVSLMGDWNWWLPSWMRWMVPHEPKEGA
jgi:RND superfamily putative drug exporter